MVREYVAGAPGALAHMYDHAGRHAPPKLPVTRTPEGVFTPTVQGERRLGQPPLENLRRRVEARGQLRHHTVAGRLIEGAVHDALWHHRECVAPIIAPERLIQSNIGTHGAPRRPRVFPLREGALV